MTPRLHVLLTCDTDPNPPGPSTAHPPADLEAHFRWAHLEEIVRGCHSVLPASRVRFTWLLRSDAQTEVAFGDPAYAVRRFASLWEEAVGRGDEIGWHPHLWRWHEKEAFWYQETTDRPWMESCFRRGFEAFPPEFRPRSVRTGNTYLDDGIVALLDRLGLEFELSVIPGFVYEGDALRPDGSYRCNVMDFGRCPADPFHPSSTDFRLPGSPHHGLVEVPVTVFRHPPLVRVARRVNGWLRPGRTRRRGKKTGTARDHSPFIVMKDSRYYRPGLRDLVRRVRHRGGSHVLLGYFHPHEAVPGLRLFSLANLARNLRVLTNEAEREGVELVYTTPSAAAATLRELAARLIPRPD